MDIKTTFLNGDLHENVSMTQPEGFVVEDMECTCCKLKKKFIYGLKQASRQWHIKFGNVIHKFGFAGNKRDNNIYIKEKSI